jgi:DNA-binding response OmpR family regulator
LKIFNLKLRASKTALRKTAPSLPEAGAVLRFGEVEVNTLNYTVKVARKLVAFTKKEFEVLVYLAKRPGRVVTRDTLLNEIWGDDVVVIDRTIDVHIRKIREKLGDDNMHLIETMLLQAPPFRATANPARRHRIFFGNGKLEQRSGPAELRATRGLRAPAGSASL